MYKHELKTCPHCQKEFECKCGDIINCQCQQVELKQQHRNHLSKLYNDCLCADCIVLIRTEYNIKQSEMQIQKILLSR